jgi:hypothetical protein
MTITRILARSTVAAALSVAAAGPLHAQLLGGTGAIVAPHFTQYTFGSGAGERTVSQMAIPFVVLMPFSERFSMDITTAYATTTLKSGGSTQSTINGLTDTQIRGNLTMGNQMLVLTFGVNIPTGQYTVDADQTDAAGQIGNDFLNYPISSMGNGLAGTGGVAFARALGSWNLGLGASMRKSTEFAAYALAASEFRFTPADEYRVSVGLDRPVGDGEIAFGMAYSAYGADAIDTTNNGSGRTTANTGDRLTVNGMWSRPVGRGDLYLSAWNLYRLEGQQFGGDAPAENVANLNAAYSVELGGILVQPSLEGRFWQIDGARAGQVTNLNVRLRFEAGRLSLFPSVGYSLGTLYNVSTGDPTDVTGLRGALTLRFN